MSSGAAVVIGNDSLERMHMNASGPISSERADLKCPDCFAEIPDVSRFCLSCGKPIPPPRGVVVEPQTDPDPQGLAMLLFGLSFMMFFFSLAPMFLGLWIGVAALVAAGLAMVTAGYFIIRSGRKEIERRREMVSAKTKCSYCGVLNDQTASKCEGCGAAL